MHSRERVELDLQAGEPVAPESIHGSKATIQEIPSAASRPSAPTDLLTPDLVLQGCVEREWRLDSTLLSFNQASAPRGAEEFRSLRSSLYQMQQKAPLKTLLVASALPNEGRSFVAANLALVMGLQTECRVLLLDADLHKPRLHSLLGTDPAPGLAEY